MRAVPAQQQPAQPAAAAQAAATASGATAGTGTHPQQQPVVAEVMKTVEVCPTKPYQDT